MEAIIGIVLFLVSIVLPLVCVGRAGARKSRKDFAGRECVWNSIYALVASVAMCTRGALFCAGAVVMGAGGTATITSANTTTASRTAIGHAEKPSFPRPGNDVWFRGYSGDEEVYLQPPHRPQANGAVIDNYSFPRDKSPKNCYHTSSRSTQFGITRKDLALVHHFVFYTSGAEDSKGNRAKKTESDKEKDLKKNEELARQRLVKKLQDYGYTPKIDHLSLAALNALYYEIDWYAGYIKYYCPMVKIKPFATIEEIRKQNLEARIIWSKIRAWEKKNRKQPGVYEHPYPKLLEAANIVGANSPKASPAKNTTAMPERSYRESLLYDLRKLGVDAYFASYSNEKLAEIKRRAEMAKQLRGRGIKVDWGYSEYELRQLLKQP